MSFIKSTAFKYIPILVFAIIIADYFFAIAGIGSIAEVLRQFAVVISNIALGLGVISLLRIHGKTVLKRAEGRWLYSIVTIVTFVTVFILGLINTNGAQYQWAFRNVYTTLEQTMYASTGFFIVSSAYRAFRARNIDAALLLIAGCIVVFTNAPIGEVIWSGFPVIGDWLLGPGQLPGYRVLMLIAGLGTIVYAYRVITGNERGFFGGGE
ncbi:MAG: hypothetical protein ABIJ47_00865 [Candidatus Bathyarchaeota archaeon]